MRPATRADLALLAATCIWGCTFVLVRGALTEVSPMLFLAMRFGLAAVLCLPLAGVLRGGLAWREAGAGLLLGGLLAAGFALQTLGLIHIGPRRSAFVTSLYVLLVPLFAIPLFRRLPSVASILGGGCAFAGLALMTGGGGPLSARPGDLLTLGCAACFALHILAVGAFTARFDYRRLLILQVLAAGLLLLPGPLLEEVRWSGSARAWAAIAITAGPATSLALYVQNRVQRRTTANRAAIIFATEPVFAALLSLAVPDEPAPGLREAAGAALILAGVLISELRPPGRAAVAPAVTASSDPPAP